MPTNSVFHGKVVLNKDIEVVSLVNFDKGTGCWSLAREKSYEGIHFVND